MTHAVGAECSSIAVQEQLESIAPAGWTLGLDSFSVGDVSPTLTGWQVFNNATTGEVEALTADLEFESTTFSMNIAGTGPFVGSFTGARYRSAAAASATASACW